MFKNMKTLKENMLSMKYVDEIQDDHLSPIDLGFLGACGVNLRTSG